MLTTSRGDFGGWSAAKGNEMAKSQYFGSKMILDCRNLSHKGRESLPFLGKRGLDSGVRKEGDGGESWS